MWHAVHAAAAAVGDLLADLAGSVAGAAPGWLALGVLLHLANQVLRGRAWYGVVRVACGSDERLRRRDAIGAWVVGAAAGGVASARGGDAARVLLLSRRLPGAGCSVLVGTLAAEGAGELALGAALVAIALVAGVGPSLELPALSTMLIATVLVVASGIAASRLPRVHAIAACAGRGCAALRSPAAYARGVLPWQAASRLCRLGALECFLLAFGLPAAPLAVLLVVFAQTGGRLLPFGPASVGAGVAMLAATFEPVTGTAVPAAQLAAFFVGMSTVLTLVGLALAVPICVGSVRPGRLMQAVRGGRPDAGAQISANDGRSLGAWFARRLSGRATSVPAP